MVKYFICIEIGSVNNMGVRLGVVWEQSVQQLESVMVHRVSPLVCGQGIGHSDSFTASHAMGSLFVAHIKPDTDAGKVEFVRPPARKSGFDNISRISTDHSFLQQRVERTVHVQFLLTQFTEGRQRQTPPLCFFSKDIATVQARPAHAGAQPLDEGACSASGVARDRDLDHAHTHSWKQMLHRLVRGPSKVMTSPSHSGHDGAEAGEASVVVSFVVDGAFLRCCCWRFERCWRCLVWLDTLAGLVATKCNRGSLRTSPATTNGWFL